jgi:hypothetical protein
MLKEADGLARRVQDSRGLAQEPRETVSRLRYYMTAAGHGIEATKGLAICVPGQSFD